MSASATALWISCSLSRAASSPTWGYDPAPSPRVRCLPIRIRWSAFTVARCIASVLTAYRVVPAMPSSCILLTVLDPPPPHPMTAILVIMDFRTASRSLLFCGGSLSAFARFNASSTIDLMSAPSWNADYLLSSAHHHLRRNYGTVHLYRLPGHKVLHQRSGRNSILPCFIRIKPLPGND